jgi:hypothetical protein
MPWTYGALGLEAIPRLHVEAARLKSKRTPKGGTQTREPDRQMFCLSKDAGPAGFRPAMVLPRPVATGNMEANQEPSLMESQ